MSLTTSIKVNPHRDKAEDLLIQELSSAFAHHFEDDEV